MSANWSNPLTTTAYATVLSDLKDRDLDVAKGLDPAVVTPTNVVANMIRWTSASNKWQKYDGAAWVDLTATYAINISGTASNITGTLAVNKGGTNITSYAVGDILYASTTSALSKLAGVATGNALISGGVGVAPSWGKIALATHVSGTLPAANGGTGQASYAVGDLLYASTTTAISKLADVATGNALISGGVGVAPSYGKVGLTTHISGVLGVANGGTNAATAADARTSLGAAADADVVKLTGNQPIAGTKTFSSPPLAKNAAKMWINFNGTGTPSTVGSHNVSSITDNGVGDYTINMTTATATNNSSVSGIVAFDGSTVPIISLYTGTSITTTSVRVNTRRADTRDLTDYSQICVQVFGD